MDLICDCNSFENVFDEILSSLPWHDNLNKEYVVVIDRIKKLVTYNIPHRTKIRGYLVPIAYQSVCDFVPSEEQIHLSYVLGWCFQILQGYLTILDDVIDNDDNRFGQASWWKLIGKKHIVASDIILLKHVLNQVLLKYFGHLPVYPKLVTYFSQVAREYLLGQNLNYHTSSRCDPEMANFSMDKYNTCVKLTIKKYVFSGLHDAALILVEKPLNGVQWEKVDTVLEQLTFYWAVIDDLYDSFGIDMANPVTHGDIIMGSCKWLILKAEELATSEQWNQLKTAYGKEDHEKVKQVLKIYNDLGIPKLCNEYLAKLQLEIEANIAQILEDGMKIGQLLQYLLIMFSKLNE